MKHCKDRSFRMLSLAAFFFFFLSRADAQPTGNANTFTNPILGGDYPDPTIMRDGKDYYMTHSAFDYVPGLTVWHSTFHKNFC